MLPSEIRLELRLNERGYEHHSQYRPIAEVYQCTIHKYTTITVYNSRLLYLLHMVTLPMKILTAKYSYNTVKEATNIILSTDPLLKCINVPYINMQ